MKTLKHVEVRCIPDVGGWIGPKTAYDCRKADADQLVKAIKKHCSDDCDDIWTVPIFECSECGEESEDRDTPCSCNKGGLSK